MQGVTEPLERIGLPACAVTEQGRIVAWNAGAEAFFAREARDVLGREWHGIIRTLQADGCCALCHTRRAMREGETLPPLDVTLSIDGYHRNVTIIALPASVGNDQVLTFLVLTQEVLGASHLSQAAPVPIRSRVRRLDDDRIIESLTERERDIMNCVVEGQDARTIAAELGISHATARNYVQRILTKLGARNKAEAVNLVITYNLLAG